MCAENFALCIQRLWAAPGICAAAKSVCEGCELCPQDAAVRIQPPCWKRPAAAVPFQEPPTDHAELPKALGCSYLLVTADQLAGRVAAFPAVNLSVIFWVS